MPDNNSDVSNDDDAKDDWEDDADANDDEGEAEGDENEDDAMSAAREILPDMDNRTPATWHVGNNMMVANSGIDVPAKKTALYEIWKHGRHIGLALEVMKHEIEGMYEGSATNKSDDARWVAKFITLILKSSEDCVIEAVTFGNLARDRRRDPKLAAYLQRLWKKAQYMPSIYHQQLVNKKGESPSATQLGIMIDCMRSYAKGSGHPLTKNLAVDVDHTLANKIDNIRHSVDPARSDKGFRWYLWKEKEDSVEQYGAQTNVNLLVEGRVREVLHFCERLEERLKQIPEADRDKPLTFPLVQVGCSRHSLVRLENHSAHIGSKYVMNLMESIGKVTERAVKDLFQIEQAVIYLMWTPEQAEIAEIGWTRLSDGYIGNGGGFSHYPTGRGKYYSVQRANSPMWEYAMTVARTGSPLCSNLERMLKDQKKAEADRKEIYENLLKLNADSDTHQKHLQSLQVQIRQTAQSIRASQRSISNDQSQHFASIIENLLWRKDEFAIEQLQPTLRNMFERITIMGQAPSVSEQLSDNRPSRRVESEEQWGRGAGPSQLGPRR
jgi:hypothetical protein